jgi:hypothetical protein
MDILTAFGVVSSFYLGPVPVGPTLVWDRVTRCRVEGRNSLYHYLRYPEGQASDHPQPMDYVNDFLSSEWRRPKDELDSMDWDAVSSRVR